MIPGRCHPLMINLSGNAHEASRIPVRLRIATGTYILQCNRASYNQFESDATCNLCGKSDETLTHFLLECETLQSCRQPIITEIELACNSLCATLGTSTLGVVLKCEIGLISRNRLDFAKSSLLNSVIVP